MCHNVCDEMLIGIDIDPNREIISCPLLPGMQTDSFICSLTMVVPLEAPTWKSGIVGDYQKDGMLTLLVIC